MRFIKYCNSSSFLLKKKMKIFSHYYSLKKGEGYFGIDKIFFFFFPPKEKKENIFFLLFSWRRKNRNIFFILFLGGEGFFINLENILLLLLSSWRRKNKYFLFIIPWTEGIVFRFRKYSSSSFQRRKRKYFLHIIHCRIKEKKKKRILKTFRPTRE